MQEGDYPLFTESRYGLCILNGGHIHIDLADFQNAVDNLRKCNSDRNNASNNFEQILFSYHGELMEDDIYDDWLTIEREKYKIEYIACAFDYIGFLQELGDTDKTERVLLSILDQDPINEDACYLLISLYIKANKKEKARLIYSSFERIMRDSIGTIPDIKLKSLLNE